MTIQSNTVRVAGVSGWLVATVVLLANLAGCGTQSAPSSQPQPTVPVVHATARQVARAMDQDRFFATYGNTILLVQATILSLSRHDHNTILELRSGLPVKVLCDLGHHSTSLRTGAAVTVESTDPQQDASRAPAGVMIRNCRIHSR